MSLLWVIPTIAALIGLDQWTKIWAAAELAGQKAIVVIPGVFELNYTENPGVAFSMLENQRWLFIPLSLLITGFFLAVLLRSPLRKHAWFNLICALILSGAIGNLIDRIAYGYVIDFLSFCLIDFPIFNVADCCVVVGAFALFAAILFGMKKVEEVPLRTLLLGIPVKNKEKNDG